MNKGGGSPVIVGLLPAGGTPGRTATATVISISKYVVLIHKSEILFHFSSLNCPPSPSFSGLYSLFSSFSPSIPPTLFPLHYCSLSFLHLSSPDLLLFTMILSQLPLNKSSPANQQQLPPPPPPPQHYRHHLSNQITVQPRQPGQRLPCQPHTSATSLS